MPLIVLPGWNLIAVTPGTIITGADAPFYTFDASGQFYLPEQDLHPGIGYWAHFAGGETNQLVANLPTAPQPFIVGEDKWAMIGNPFTVCVNVTGADVVYAYDYVAANTGQNPYQQTTLLHAGQGAWAYSADGATISMTAAAPYAC